MVQNIFNSVPKGFFNLLASPNKQMHSDILQVIYEQYDMEISYRISRQIVRDAIVAYLVDHQLDYPDEEKRTIYTRASDILNEYKQADVGWIEEETDDNTYEKYIVMTENGIMLAEFLQHLAVPEREEYTSYIYNIYNTLMNEQQWESDPYVMAIKPVYKNAKALANSLKKLSTFIRKKIEQMAHEQSLRDITDNLIRYCDGDFVKEYSRLTKQLNIKQYRDEIIKKLDQIYDNDYEITVTGCAIEEELNEYDASEKIELMISATKRFLLDDYNAIINDIKYKINVYLQIALARLSMVDRNKADALGNTEQVLNMLIQALNNENVEIDTTSLFHMQESRYLDLSSMSYPKVQKSINVETTSEYISLTDIEKAEMQNKITESLNNPFSNRNVKKYIDSLMQGKSTLSIKDVPIVSKKDILMVLNGVLLDSEQGFEIEVSDEVVEIGDYIISDFQFIKTS